MKKDAYYFSHDSNARSDEEIIALRMKQGWQGYGLYWAIIEKLRDSTGYKLAADYNLIAFDLRVDAAIIKNIVCDFGLFAFTEKGECFYSESLMRRMAIADGKSEKARESANERWKSDRNADVMRTHSNRNASKVKKSKVKENVIGADAPEQKFLIDLEKRQTAFYETLKIHLPTYGKDLLRKFYDYWREPNKSKTRMRFEQEKTWDLKLRLQRWASNDFSREKSEETVYNGPTPNEEKAQKILNEVNN